MNLCSAFPFSCLWPWSSCRLHHTSCSPSALPSGLGTSFDCTLPGSLRRFLLLLAFCRHQPEESFGPCSAHINWSAINTLPLVKPPRILSMVPYATNQWMTNSSIWPYHQTRPMVCCTSGADQTTLNPIHGEHIKVLYVFKCSKLTHHENRNQSPSNV